MNEWITKIILDIKRGSVIQFVVTIMVIIGFTGYEVSRGLSPIATTAILYWDGGFTDEEIERSKLHGLCDNMTEWPMSIFVEPDPVLSNRCKYLKQRHMFRTSEDWYKYQLKARELQLGEAAGKEAKKAKVPDAPIKGNDQSVDKQTPKDKGQPEGQPP